MKTVIKVLFILLIALKLIDLFKFFSKKGEKNEFR